MPLQLCAAATAAPLRLDARRNTQRCSHVRTTITSRPGTLVLQPLLRHCFSTPSKVLLRWANARQNTWHCSNFSKLEKNPKT
jgi:hypothetical protein